jgi:hypothetical protein
MFGPSRPASGRHGHSAQPRIGRTATDVDGRLNVFDR